MLSKETITQKVLLEAVILSILEKLLKNAKKLKKSIFGSSCSRKQRIPHGCFTGNFQHSYLKTPERTIELADVANHLDILEHNLHAVVHEVSKVIHAIVTRSRNTKP